jgi:hypothetical protein
VTELEAIITDVLGPLLGLKLVAATTVGNMRYFYFGVLRRTAEGRLGHGIADFDLCVSCPWRIESPGMIVVGSGDYYDRASDNEDPKWKPGKPWGTRQNELLEMLLGGVDPETQVLLNTTDHLVVEGIAPDPFGGVTLSLSDQYRLVVFPSSTQDIDWILHAPSDRAGLMVTGGDFTVFPPRSESDVA